MKSLLSLLGRYLLTLSAVAVATLLAFILWKHYVQPPGPAMVGYVRMWSRLRRMSLDRF